MKRWGVRGWVVTFGGAGLSPRAPGSVASLSAVALLYIGYLGIAQTGTPFFAWQSALAGVLLAASAATVLLGPWAIAYYGRNDPQPVVLDEVAGICLTWLGQPVIRAYGGAVVPVLVFVAFRIFDIAKPWPASRLERLPNGWGILADDLAAAVYANLICQVLLRLAWPGMLFRG